MDASSKGEDTANDQTQVRGWRRFNGSWEDALSQWRLPAAIMFATFLAYVDMLALGFVFDDHVLIVTNDSIRSWRYFPSYFTSHIWSFRYPHLLANYYRPLFLTWLRLNHALFELHPWGWHLTSVLAHVAVTYLVYRLALLLTRDRWVAVVAGAIFGLHPVHAEAVADITTIQEPLSTFFILAAVLAFASSCDMSEEARWPWRRGGVTGVPPVPGHGQDGHGTEDVPRASRPCSSMARMAMAQEPCHGRPAREGAWPGWPRLWKCRKGWLAAALVFTAAALLSKESGMVLPVLICGYTWIYGAGNGREVSAMQKGPSILARAIFALVASIPFWLVVLVYVPVRIHALKGFAHVITPLPISTVIFTIPSVLFFYLRLVFWPSGLSCYYDTSYILTPGWSNCVLPAILLLAIAAAIAFWYVHTRRSALENAKVIAFAGLWMVLTLVPVLNFRFLPEGEIAHDRYVYLSSVGFVILVAMAVRTLIRNFSHARRRKRQIKDETGDLQGSEAPSSRSVPDASPVGEP